MNLEELEGRDDVKGINRAKKEKGPIRPSEEREEGRSDCFKDGSARVERERATEREKLPPFPVLTLQCFLTAREGLRERLERDGLLLGESRQKEIERGREWNGGQD